jgi:hypothetical protein
VIHDRPCVYCNRPNQEAARGRRIRAQHLRDRAAAERAARDLDSLAKFLDLARRRAEAVAARRIAADLWALR